MKSLKFLLPSAPLFVCLAAGLLSAAEETSLTYDTPEAAAHDPDFAMQGEYSGDGRGAQVIALGNGRFRIVSFPGGLPGAGWNGEEKTTVEGDAGTVKNQTAGLTRMKRANEMLGLKPPAGAIVLFDGRQETLDQHWRPGAQMTKDGLLMQGATSVDTFQDYVLHLEFRLPYMPEARGQGRGNSGLYLHGRYELQILDSFGLDGENNECGGIYTIARPQVNMCLPPLQWQTYDVDFTAARFDNDGKQKTANAKTTIRQNGVLIHDELDLPTLTPGGVFNVEDSQPGPVFLQNHGNPVRFRNIWVVPKN